MNILQEIEQEQIKKLTAETPVPAFDPGGRNPPSNPHSAKGEPEFLRSSWQSSIPSG